MTRTIKVSEVRPGMEVQWTSLGITRRCTGEVVDGGSPRYGVHLRTSEGGAVHIPGDAEVTVLAEPQPKEPVTLCARIVVAGRKIYRWTEDPKEPWPWRGEALNVDPVLWSWGQLCGLGHVTVIDADPPWTTSEDAPEDTLVVPERIEEWPEDDTALRKHRWKDDWGDTWTWITAYSEWECRNFLGEYQNSLVRPSSGPWTRA